MGNETLNKAVKTLLQYGREMGKAKIISHSDCKVIKVQKFKIRQIQADLFWRLACFQAAFC